MRSLLSFRHIFLSALAISAAVLSAASPAYAAAPGSGWMQTFDDEFSGPLSYTVGSSGGVWRTTYQSWNGGARTLTGNAEEECYMDSSVGLNPFSVQNGVLSIAADRSSSNPCNLPYSSGQINTSPSFSQTYGYFEMRAQLPAGQGLWPAFWLLPADASWPPELDIMEMLGQDPSTIYNTIFSTQTGTQKSYATQGSVVGDPLLAFHTYGADWEPNTVTYYFDDRQIAQFTTPSDMNKPMYLIANLAVGGKWPGSPNASTTFPVYMMIDYIRAYTKNTATSTSVSPPSNALVIGTHVKTTTGLNVRSRASNGGKIVGTQSSGAYGTIVGGPSKSSGIVWWNINFDAGVDGWSAQDYLTAQIIARGYSRYLASTGIADLTQRLAKIQTLLNQLLNDLSGKEPGTGVRP